METFIRSNTQEMTDLLIQLCGIPAPSHQEQKRAEFLAGYFQKMGVPSVCVDDALNVIIPFNCEGSNEITVVVAHTDTVFPDTEPMPMRVENGRLYCPGVGDDTASVVSLAMMIKYCVETNYKPKGGILFVCNSCEEGLGNLKGTRKIFETYKGRIRQFVSLDSENLARCTDSCVGSHRYEVTVQTEGGHSFSCFGNANAIDRMAAIVRDIYSIQVPKKGDSTTTYNVGTITGGTSVNTIAQSCTLLCEYRSDSMECLEIMRQNFEKIFEKNSDDKTKITVKQIGERPCGVDSMRQDNDYMRKYHTQIVREVLGKEPEFSTASTDCNIPMSLGIPAICIAAYEGRGCHTREEYVELSSLPTGLEIGLKLLLKITEAEA